MTTGNSISIPALPSALHWYGAPQSWELKDNVLTVRAGRITDWFINPDGTAVVLNAPALLFNTREVCMLKAKAVVEHKSMFDAGVLAVYQDDQTWAKLCLELSPQGKVMIVSVVTKGTSDDCNSLTIDGHSVHMRIAKLERAYAFHYSLDGHTWNLVRYFTLGGAQSAELGFLSQSPTGEGCSASFSSIAYLPQKLKDVRSGE